MHILRAAFNVQFRFDKYTIHIEIVRRKCILYNQVIKVSQKVDPFKGSSGNSNYC